MKTYFGFSLIEVTIALLVVGLLTTGLIVPFAKQMDAQKIKQTNKKLEQIKEALFGFAVIHERLPCPDADTDGLDGFEDFPCDASSINTQNSLPWATLGIGKLDGWKRQFRYRVDEEYANGIPDSLKTDIDNKLVVKGEQTGYKLTSSEEYDDGTLLKYSRIIAIVFSCGRNGYPESSNNTITATYVRGNYVENTFDDQLTWLSKYTLMRRLLIAKKLPPKIYQ